MSEQRSFPTRILAIGNIGDRLYAVTLELNQSSVAVVHVHFEKPGLADGYPYRDEYNAVFGFCPNALRASACWAGMFMRDPTISFPIDPGDLA